MKITLRNKVLGLTFVSVLSIAVVISVISITQIFSRGEERIADYRATLLSERKQQLKGCVEMAVRVMEKMPPEDAKKVIRNMRYGQSGYLWLNDYSNVILVHADQRLEGKDLSSLQDPNGVYIVRDITRMCREKGEGYLNYMWKAPGQ
ncbi:MAG TPA: cache domain-containing protein, partial [Desulfuromonadaceae bacterium]